MVSYRHPAGWGLCIPAPSIWCLLSSHWLVCRSTLLIGWHRIFHPLVKRCYWWTQSWNAAALETTVDDAVGWQGKGLGIAGDQKRGFWARWDPENGLFWVRHNFKVDKAKTKTLGALRNSVYATGGGIGPVVLFSKALIRGFKLISPLKIIHFLVSD